MYKNCGIGLHKSRVHEIYLKTETGSSQLFYAIELAPIILLTFYLSDFVEPNSRRPAPDDYFTDRRSDGSQFDHRNVAVHRQEYQVGNLHTTAPAASSVPDYRAEQFGKKV